MNINVQVQPNARRNEVMGCEDGVWRVKVAAPPVKGKANRELVGFLSKLLGVSKGSITIVKGATSRRKLISIEGLSQEKVLRRLAAASPKPGSDSSTTTTETQGTLFSDPAEPSDEESGAR